MLLPCLFRCTKLYFVFGNSIVKEVRVCKPPVGVKLNVLPKKLAY